MAQQFYVAQGDKAVGPVTPAELREMARRGQVQAHTQITMDGQKWFAASVLNGLEFAPAPPPPVATTRPVPPAAPVPAARPVPPAPTASPRPPAPSAPPPGNRPNLAPQGAAGSVSHAANGASAPSNSAPAQPSSNSEIDRVEGTTKSLLRQFLNDDQDPGAVARLLPKVEQILMSGEEILYIAVQKKPVANINPDCIVLTTKRFIFYEVTLLGRIKFEDRIWRELRDARIEEGILGATFSIQAVNGAKLSLDYLPKAQARQLYRFAQEMEEKSLEERRQRDLEVRRAGATGVFVNGPAPAQAAPPAPTEDPVQKLSKLKQMADAGLITAQEYEAKKTEILSRM